MWIETAHPLFWLSVTQQPQQQQQNSSVSNTSSAAAPSTSSPNSSFAKQPSPQQQQQQPTTIATSFQIQYKIDEEHSVSSGDVFHTRTSALRLLRHPNVLKITTEQQHQQMSESPSSFSASSSAASNNQRQQQLSLSSSSLSSSNIPKIKSTHPTFVVPLCHEWKFMHPSEIIHGVYEVTTMLAFILEKTGLRFTSFSSTQLFRDIPDCDLRWISERNTAADTSTSSSSSSSSSSSFPAPLFFGSSATPVSPLRYRWVLGDGKSFFDRLEFIRSPTKETFSSGFSSSLEQDNMLMQSSVSAIARWLTSDVISTDKVKLNERNAVLVEMIRNWAEKVEEAYVNSGEEEVQQQNQQQQHQDEQEQKDEQEHQQQETKVTEVEQQQQQNQEPTSADENQRDTVAEVEAEPTSLESRVEASIAAADATLSIPVKDLPDLEKNRFKQRLTNFYTKHSAENLKSVELALKMNVYESTIFEKVCAKYNVDPLQEFTDAVEQNVAPIIINIADTDKKKQLSSSSSSPPPPLSPLKSPLSTPLKSPLQNQTKVKPDWSIQLLHELIELLHNWAITERNDSLAVVLHIGQHLHTCETLHVENLFDILAESITLVPCQVAARRIWPWLIRPGYLSQQFASKAFVRLINFARATAAGVQNHHSSNNNNNQNQQHQQSIRDVLGPLIASTVTLTLVTSARNVFSIQRSNSLDVITACLSRKIVEGPKEERKVASLPGLSVPVLIRIVVPELLFSLIQILMSITTTITTTSTSTNSQQQQQQSAMIQEFLGTPLQTISLLCQMNLSDNKQLFQAAQQIQKGLADKISSSSSTNAFGGKETCYGVMNSNNNNGNNVKSNAKNVTEQEKWNCALRHLDCLDCVLVNLFELMVHSAVQQQQSNTATNNNNNNNTEGATSALRTKVFESLVVPVLGFAFMNVCSLAKQQEEKIIANNNNNVVDSSLNSSGAQKEPIKIREEEQKKDDVVLRTTSAAASIASASSSKPEVTTAISASVDKVKDKNNQNNKQSEYEVGDDSPVQIPDFAAERKREKKNKNNTLRGTKMSVVRRRRTRRRYKYSDDDDDNDDDHSHSSYSEDEEEEEFEEEAEEEEQQEKNQDDIRENGHDYDDDGKENSTVKEDEASRFEEQSFDKDSKENPTNEADFSPLASINNNNNTPPQSASLTLLSHLSRMLSKILFVWHQPGAVQNPASRGLIWQIILRGANIVNSSSSSSSSSSSTTATTNQKIKLPPRVASAIFDPFVEAAMSIKEAIEFELGSQKSIQGNTTDTENNQNETQQASSSSSSSSFSLSSSQRTSAAIYFEVTQYLTPSLLHLSMRGFSSISIQLLMKMLHLNDFLDNLRITLRCEKDRKNVIKNENDNESELEQSPEEQQARTAMSLFVLPWSIQLDAATNNLLQQEERQQQQQQQQQHQKQLSSSLSSSPNVTSKNSKATLIAQLWSNLPSLRQVCSQKLIFFRGNGSSSASPSSSSLLGEIATGSLDASNNAKNQVNWIMNTLSDCILATTNSSNNQNQQHQQRQNEMYPTCAALINGGSFVSCPPGIPNAVDSDLMMRSWYRNFISAGHGVGTHSERSALIHLISRFGGKEFDAFPLMPPMQ